MRTKFAVLLAIAAVCVTTTWAGWAPEERVTTNTNYCNMLCSPAGHSVVATSGGVRHLVWAARDLGHGGDQLYTATYKRYYPGSGWTRDLQLPPVNTGFSPVIALDPNGWDIHVLWHGDVVTKKKVSQHVFYQKCVPGSSGNGGWVGAPMDLTPDGWGMNFPRSVACFQDQAHVTHVVVTWTRSYNTFGFRECVGGNWGNTTYFTPPSIPGHDPLLWPPSIAVDPQGRYGDVFISYCQVDPDDLSSLLVVRRQGGVWQNPECVAASYLPSVAIEVDPSTGYPHIVCGTILGGHVYNTYWDPSGGWQPLEMISDPSASTEAVNMFFSGGSAFVVWAESSSASEGIRYRIGKYGNWTAPAWVISGYHDESPNVTASSTGNVYVVWERGEVPLATQIWGRLYTPGSGGGQAEPISVSQSGIELFPNPAKAGRVTVSYSLPRAEPVKVTLLDVSGRAVRTQEIPATDRSGSFSIDVSGLNAGVYVARLVAGDLSVSKSLVVER